MERSSKTNKRISLLRDQLCFNKTDWVLKNIELQPLPVKTESLKGKTLFITGASRGIGLTIALKAAEQGANIAVVAKTVTEQKNLEGTIFTAVEQINKAGGKGLAIQCDIRSEESVKAAVEKTVQTFGGIDILINNASAISLTQTLETDMKKYDLMHSINSRGTFMCAKYCIPYLKKSSNPHILTISPPILLEERWLKDYPAYALAKMGMSVYSLSFSYELKEEGIASNTLWPRTAIATAAVKNILGGDIMMERSREPAIMADSANYILNSDASKVTGNAFLDDEVLIAHGEKDISRYNCVKGMKNEELVPDFMC